MAFYVQSKFFYLYLGSRNRRSGRYLPSYDKRTNKLVSQNDLSNFLYLCDDKCRDLENSLFLKLSPKPLSNTCLYSWQLLHMYTDILQTNKIYFAEDKQTVHPPPKKTKTVE